VEVWARYGEQVALDLIDFGRFRHRMDSYGDAGWIVWTVAGLGPTYFVGDLLIDFGRFRHRMDSYS
jgi:hypothetical protein